MNESKKLLDTIMQAHNTQQMILPDGSLSSLNSIKTRMNHNTIVLATSGGGKTRGVVIPNILAAFWSYVISDPKGTLYKNYAKHFRQCGYRVVHLDLIHPERSDGYNPLKYLRTTDEIVKFAHLLVYANGGGESTDPFWDRATELLLSALIAFVCEQNGNAGTISDIIEITRSIDANQLDNGDGTCDMDRKMEEHAGTYRHRHGKESWAYRQWLKFRSTPVRTFNCVLITLHALLTTLDTEEMQSLLCCDEMDITSIGKEKTVVFVEISDTDRSKDIIANTFYGQAMNRLCEYADSLPESRLPVPVRFILDDFGTNVRIEGFQNMIANIRSRNISTIIVIQSLAQLDAGYGASAQTIVDNCDTLLYMGGRDKSTIELISQLSNKPFNKIMEMPIGMHWKIQRGRPAEYGRTVDLSEYDLSFLQDDKADNRDQISG